MTDLRSRAWTAAATVTDPEIPVLTIADLGILRDVAITGDGAVAVVITPTYSGCPAMDTIAADVNHALHTAGFERVDVRTVHSPAWTTDWMTRGRSAQADRVRHRTAVPPRAVRTGDAHPGPAHRPRRPLPAVRGARSGTEPVRLDVVQGSVRLYQLCRALRLLQGHLMAAPEAPTDTRGVAEPPVRRRHAAFHPLQVARLDRLTDDAVAITFEVPAELAEEFRFKPGQHVAVRALLAGDDVRRSYSICAPAGSDTLRIGVKRLPDGVFSSYALDHLAVGDVVEVLSPAGTFTPPLEAGRTHCYGAVAAGSGITPILSILATALQVEPHSRAILIYLNATSRSIMFLEELEDLKNRFLGRFQLIHVLGHEAQDAELLSGRLDPERLTALLDTFGGDAVDSWFLCGPRPLTDMVTATLVARGVPAGCVHRELFHADALPPRRVNTTGGRRPRLSRLGHPRRRGVPTSPCPVTPSRCWTLRSGCGTSYPSPARTACAAPAGAG